MEKDKQTIKEIFELLKDSNIGEPFIYNLSKEEITKYLIFNSEKEKSINHIWNKWLNIMQLAKIISKNYNNGNEFFISHKINTIIEFLYRENYLILLNEGFKENENQATYILSPKIFI